MKSGQKDSPLSWLLLLPPSVLWQKFCGDGWDGCEVCGDFAGQDRTKIPSPAHLYLGPYYAQVG